MNDSNNKFDYTSGNYLNRVFLSLLALNRVDKDQLLAIDVCSEALYELLYAATVTGIEEYLQERLINEVFISDENKKKYVKTFNHNFHRKSTNQRKNLFPLKTLRFLKILPLFPRQTPPLCRWLLPHQETYFLFCLPNSCKTRCRNDGSFF